MNFSSKPLLNFAPAWVYRINSAEDLSASFAVSAN
jgi:hypothetical protein